MTKWCLMLKRGLSTILHHTSFFTEKFECSPGSIKEVNVSFFFFCKVVLTFQTLSLGVTTPHITPALEFAHSIFGHYNLAVLIFGKALQGGLIKHVLTMRSKDLTCNPSPPNT